MVNATAWAFPTSRWQTGDEKMVRCWHVPRMAGIPGSKYEHPVPVWVPLSKIGPGPRSGGRYSHGSLSDSELASLQQEYLSEPVVM